MIIANFYAPYFPKTTGLLKEFGSVWIYNYDSNKNPCGGAVMIELTLDAETGYARYASLEIHYDGVPLLRKLDENGFLQAFYANQVNSLYGVFEALHQAGIPLQMNSDSYEFLPRDLYELLTNAAVKS